MAASALMRFFLLFREVLRVFLPFAFHICFAGYLLLTFISAVNLHEKKVLTEKAIDF